jgi:proteasome assembly chaperone 2
MKLINSEEDVSLTGSTLIVPAVSIGNVGQLAIDLIIETSKALKVGRFADENILPCCGAGSYSHIPGPSFAMELFTLPGNSNTFLLQQRAPVAPGLQRQFADALVSWAHSVGIAKIIILGGLDGSFRRDDQLQGSQLRYWIAGNDEDLAILCSSIPELGCLEGEWFDNDKPLKDRLTPPWPLVQACGATGNAVPCAAILAFVLEGENIPDAVNVANEAVKVVPELGAMISGSATKGWQHPASWKYAFGGARPLGM